MSIIWLFSHRNLTFSNLFKPNYINLFKFGAGSDKCSDNFGNGDRWLEICSDIFSDGLDLTFIILLWLMTGD